MLLPDAYPLAFYEVTATKTPDGESGVDISAKVKSLTLTITNNQSADTGRALGSRHPQRMIAGERVTTISQPLFYEGSGPLEELWGSSAGVDNEGPSPFGLTLTFDGGDYGSMEIDLPQVIYTQVQQQPSGRDIITQETGARALLGTVAIGADEVETEIVVVLENDQGTYKNPTAPAE